MLRCGGWGGVGGGGGVDGQDPEMLMCQERILCCLTTNNSQCLLHINSCNGVQISCIHWSLKMANHLERLHETFAADIRGKEGYHKQQNPSLAKTTRKRFLANEKTSIL